MGFYATVANSVCERRSEVTSKVRAINLLYKLTRTIGINRVFAIRRRSSLRIIFVIGASCLKIDFELLVFLHAKENVATMGQVLALLFAKIQSRVSKVSDESIGTNLVTNLEFPVSLCLHTRERRKEGFILIVWLGA